MPIPLNELIQKAKDTLAEDRENLEDNRIIAYLYQVPFNSNLVYKIEDIDDFLTQKATEFGQKILTDIDFTPFENLIGYIYVECNDNQLFNDELKKFNYVKLEYSKKNVHDVYEVYQKIYAFIVGFNWISGGTQQIKLKKDTINTYLDKCEFSEKTLVIREHIDRFDYRQAGEQEGEHDPCVALINEVQSGETIKQCYILRKIPDTSSEKFETSLIPSSNNFEIFAHDRFAFGDEFKNGDFWVKICYKDDDVNLIVCFLPAYHNFYVKGKEFDNTEVNEEVHGFYSLNAAMMKTLKTDSNVWSIEFIPYPPTNILRNAIYENTTTSARLDIRTSNYRIFKINDNVVTLAVTENFDKLTLPEQTNINKLKINFSLNSINHLLQYLMTAKIRYRDIKKAVDMLYSVPNNLFENFKELPKYFKFLNIEESALLSADFFQVNFHYLNFNYNLCLKNLEYKDKFGDNFTNFINNSSNSPTVMNFSFKPSFNKDFGLSFKFDDGNYFYIDGEKNYPFVNNVEDSLYTDNYLEYMRNGYNFDKKTLETRENSTIWSWVSTAANIAINTALAVVTHGASVPVGILSSTRSLAGSFRAQERLNKSKIMLEKHIEELKNNSTDSKNDTNSFNALISNENLKIIVKINTVAEEKRKEVNNRFYLYGNEINKHKKPTHNNRVLFDYLQCEADFDIAKVTEDELNDIKQQLYNGIYFVHRYRVLGVDGSFWLDPNKQKENMEKTLYDIIKSLPPLPPEPEEKKKEKKDEETKK